MTSTSRHASIAAPPKAMAFLGRGTRIYRGQHNAAGFGWILLGPDALLHDGAGKVVARRYFGPHWQADDGSTIKGSVLDAGLRPCGSRIQAD